MRKRLFIFLFSIFSLSVFSQRNVPATSVSMFVEDSFYGIDPVCTQSEYKPGWKIVDIQTNGKLSRYLWGRHSRQLSDDRTPRLLIETGNYKLNDFVLIKLKEKKEYRKFASHNLFECDGRHIDLDLVAIKLLDDGRYEVRPHVPLTPGEYVIVNLKAEATNDFGDVYVYPFTISR